MPLRSAKTERTRWPRAPGRGRGVADEAVVALPHKLRLVIRFLVERVKGDAELGVGRRDLDHFAAETEADVDIVVEVERSRRLRRDPFALETRLREYEHLRRKRDVQFLEHRWQVAVVVHELQLALPCIDPLLERGDDVLGLRGLVIDRLALDGVNLRAQRRHEAASDRESECDSKHDQSRLEDGQDKPAAGQSRRPKEV